VRILRPDTVALMGQNQIGLIDVGVLRTTVPAVSRDVDFFPGTKLKWGFGHMITTQPVPEGRSAGSLTWAGIYNTYYWIDPKKRIAAVFMPSRPGEFHPESLTDPDVILSHHPARATMRRLPPSIDDQVPPAAG